MLGGWILLRSALLATLPAPEPRYTLECYPVLFLLAAANARSAKWAGSTQR